MNSLLNLHPDLKLTGFTPSYHSLMSNPTHSNLVFIPKTQKPSLFICKKKGILSALFSEKIDLTDLFDPNQVNPTMSFSYRSSDMVKPNPIVLEAQGRVCTGPSQTKPMSGEMAMIVLETILQSARGELKEDKVSKAQLGAFFAAMTIRANAFPEATQWSEGERHAMSLYWPRLIQVLPKDVIFIADPEGTIMGSSSVGVHYAGQSTTEMRLVGALREVLAGGHLGYEEVEGVLRDVLPLENENPEKASESLLAAFLIGQRMNRETDRELKAYCLAFDDELGPPPIADVKSLTHYGEPYDGNTRFFKSTLFVAAVRASYGESCLLHGVEWMPPKGGITEGQMLKFMGANTHLSPAQAKILLEDENFGFAYLNQEEACPSLYSLVGLREHIKKRPPLATSEKVQQFVRGEEGAISMTTKARSENASKGLPVNYCSGFRPSSIINENLSDGISRQSFATSVNAMEYGFESTDTPRTDRSVLKNIELGIAALSGKKGPAYDRIVLNAGMIDHLLGCSGAENVHTALDRAREAIDSGKALRRLLKYIRRSHEV